MSERLKHLVFSNEIAKELEHLVEQAYQIGKSDAWAEIKAMKNAILKAERTQEDSQE